MEVILERAMTSDENASQRLLTAEEFYAAHHNRSAELVRGEVKLMRGEVQEMSPAGGNHGLIAGEIFGQLYAHVTAHNLGRVFAAETGFILQREPTTVRAPDAAFIARERIGDSRPERGFWPVAPDLAVEVMSPNDTAEDIESKIREYFAAGTRLIWVIYPQSRTIHVYPSPQRARILSAHDTLDGGELLPSFSCAVETIFR